MSQQRTILITGASGGIGRGLAEAYANEGVTLLLTGRDPTRLEEVAIECRTKGAVVETTTAGVQHPEFLSKVEAWNDMHEIDLVIANAGITSDTSQNQADDEKVFREVLSVNLMGVVNTINPVLEKMKQRKQGQVVLISSVAGLRGLPNAVAYSVSKVAVTAYGDALRPLLKEHGVTVTTILPGFIKTRMTGFNKFSMPMLMEVEPAVQKIQDAIAKKKSRYGFPWPMYAFMTFINLLPRVVGDWILITFVPRKR